MTIRHKTLRNSFHLVTSSILVFQLVIGLAYSPQVYAADPVPDRDDLINEIYEEVNNSGPNEQDIANEAAGNNDGGNNTDVVNSGDNADVDTSTNNETNTEVNNNNNANVNQQVNANANTGNNEAKGNISFGGNAGVIQTGHAIVNVDGTVNANNNTTGVSNGGNGSGNDTNVVNTGNNVDTTTNANGTTTTVVNNNNNATIHQGANANANTGNNDASGNIAIGGGVAGVVLTGDAWVDISFMTVANGSATLVGGTGNGSGPGNGADIYITNTGGRFSGIGRLYNRVDTLVNNNNNAVINQSCGSSRGQQELARDIREEAGGCNANTGGNDSSNNIAFGADAGVIQTGDAVVNVELNASANSNNTAVQNGNGGTSGNNTHVVNTGNSADVDTNTTNQTNTGINNNNNATVNQTVNANANTGNNKANYNISIGGNAGIIQTGNAVVNVVMNADVNSNATQVSGASASMDDGHGGSGNNTNVVNTGHNATVTTNTNNTTNTIITNNNALNLLQNVNAHSNTGGNDASGNMALGGGCFFSRFACGTSGAGGVAGYIGTGNAIIDNYMGVDANHNNTGDPIVSDPTGPQDPGNGDNNNNNNESDTGSATGSTNSGSNSGSNTGGTAVIAGTASQQNDDGTVSSVGRVLAAATARVLPATGSEGTYALLALAAAIFGAGMYLRKFNISKVSMRKEVKQ